MPTTDDRAQGHLLGLLRRYGRNTTSFVALGHGFRYLRIGDEGCVPFVDTGGAWVAAGAPVAALERLAEIALAFHEEAARHGRRAVFFATEARFVERASSMQSLMVGEQPVWVPAEWSQTMHRVRSLREQLRRARAKGVVVERLSVEALDNGTRARAAVDSLIARWLGTRPMPPMAFVVQVEPFTFREERRYYAAWRGDVLVGFLDLVPVFARDGWFFENLLRDPSAPNGTAELLFDTAMRDLATEGVAFATLGLAPLAGPVTPWLRRAQKWGRPLYDFAGLRAFKHKLRPARWEPVYVSIPRGGSVLVAIYDVLVAFSGRGVLRFGLATVLRGPDVVVRLLTLMLVPWTVLLAVASPPHWFPMVLVQRVWVGFDVLLTMGLVVLVVRWRRWLATALAMAITLDAMVTLGEALIWNLPRVRSVSDAVAIAIATSAPAFAALVIWNARSRHVLMTRVSQEAR